MTPRSSTSQPLSRDALSFAPAGMVPVLQQATPFFTDLPPWVERAEQAGGAFLTMASLARLVYDTDACHLPGVTIDLDVMAPEMWSAVRSGHVEPDKAEYTYNGLRYGSTIGLVPQNLRGQRKFKNYPPAEGEFRAKVSAATDERVAAGRTIDLGEWSQGLWEAMKHIFQDFSIFPLGAQAKKGADAHKARPTDNHTRTGFNGATDMDGLHHTLDTYNELARVLEYGHMMAVTDVEAAFPMLPISPWVWPHFFHRCYPPGSTKLHLYCHITGDFGTRGMPGVFKLFFVDVVTNMARAAKVLHAPIETYVNDSAICGAHHKQVNREMSSFQRWATLICGVIFKQSKDKPAAPVQLMLGFWWDSFLRTRTLEESKFLAYADLLLQFSARTSLSLRERQQMAGKMQRAVMTMPPGAACLLSNLYSLMSGLQLNWQRKRTTAAERADYRFFHDVMLLNKGRGYFSHDLFSEGDEVRSDASKQARYAGGGWCCSDGSYDWWKYGGRAARKLIDFLEGDTVVSCVERMGKHWRGKWIPFGVDNQAFQR